ncbi:MAG: xanthine dehydrogenase family protein molybdopterin-binding subunit [Alphaproteobacteria bacterium]|nr:xanthine dehydrogenase family protein molybdopterin-binding subunit [Alphaproteobacteria bacterium]
MNDTTTLSRRDFIHVGAAAGGGLALGFTLPVAGDGTAAAQAGAGTELNAWLVVGTDDTVTIRVHRSEMGQGSSTAIPQLVAEELECDWSKVRMEFASVMRHIRENKVYVSFATGGSRAIRDSQLYVRKAGATAREMLKAAAAQQWGVAASECKTEKGFVVHAASGRKAGYGALAAAAAKMAPPADVKFKPDSAWTIAGTSPPRFDVPSKVDGSAIYGMDVKVPGMVHAAIKQSPVFGGKVKSFDEAKVKSMPGVLAVVQLPDASAVAVVAERFWQAKTAMDALPIVWDEGENAKVSQATILDRLKKGLDEPGVKVRHDGDFDGAFAKAARKVEAEYFAPYLDHACMEPMNCTAHVTAEGVEVWAPTQNIEGALAAAAEAAGVGPEKVKAHLTLLGGGFGRRGRQDYVTQAVHVAKAVAGKPVKLIWTREEDIQHGSYRPISMGRLQAGFDAHGNLAAYAHKVCGQSIFAYLLPQNIRDGWDQSSMDGTYNQAYKMPNCKFDYVMRNAHVPVGFWRSVGSSQNAFITESFMDELAHAAGKDPVEFRRGLLDNKSWLNVLNMAAEKGNWGKPLPKGSGRGIAINACFGSITAHVAEVTVNARGRLKVDRVVVVLDSGHAVHPDNIAAQNEGGVAYALTAMLYGEITVKDGRVEQSNFDNYQSILIDQMPKVESYLSLTQGDWWGGVGEPSMAPLMAAVCNAIFAATGKRIRSLPLKDQDIRSV